MTKQRADVDELRIIKWLIVCALAVAVVIGVIFWWSTNAQLRDIVQVRNESRYTTCVKDRGFQLAHNRLTRSTAELVRVTFTASAANKPTPAERDATLAFMADRVAAIEKNIVPVRKCDKASIEAFYTPKGR